MTQVYHQAKFRWTENLTSRFIQLRKENGKLFTGRKYSAQAGWEFILRRMRSEFPTIMAAVHYRVLKKKWSNLLQQYKELKNPVHGDKNKADDVSWPFYGAIDEVVGNNTRRRSNLGIVTEEEEEEEEEDDNDENVVDPHEFLCVSVTPEESDHEPKFPFDEEIERNDNPSIIALQRLRTLNDDCSIEIERLPRETSRLTRKIGKPRGKHSSSNDNTLISRLPRATELSIKTIKRPGPMISVKDLSKLGFETETRNGNSSSISNRDEIGINLDDNDDYETRGRIKRSRGTRNTDYELPEHVENRLERRLEDFLEYTKRRDDENRDIMLRILQAVEKIAQKIQ